MFGLFKKKETTPSGISVETEKSVSFQKHVGDLYLSYSTKESSLPPLCISGRRFISNSIHLTEKQLREAVKFMDEVREHLKEDK